MESVFGIILLSGVIGLGVVILLVIQRRKKKLTLGERSFIRNQWRILCSGQNQRNSILDADKLLDYVLGKYGYTGSFSEKLKKAHALFSDLDAVWAAHKIRNRLAHELNFQPTPKDVEFVLRIFEQALRDLEIEL